MAKKLLVTEMLEAVGKAESRKEKLELLKQFNCLELRDVLKGAFDDTIEFI